MKKKITVYEYGYRGGTNIVKKILILFANSNSYKLNMNRNMQFIQVLSYQ